VCVEKACAVRRSVGVLTLWSPLHRCGTQQQRVRLLLVGATYVGPPNPPKGLTADSSYTAKWTLTWDSSGEKEYTRLQLLDIS